MLTLKKLIRYRLNTIRSRLVTRLLGDRAIGVVWRSWNGLLCLPVTDMVIARTLASKGDWDKETISYLLQLVGPDSRALVVGAHVGSVAIPLARVCREVVAYEANPNTFEILNLNIRLNGVENVSTKNAAAFDKPGRLKMYLNKTNTGSSKIVPRQVTYAYVYDSPEEVDVPAVAIDDDLVRHDFDLVVIDIEGSEQLALKGMPKVLERCRHLQIEYLPHLIRDVTGATDDMFLAPLQQNFTSARIAGEPGEYARPQFDEMLAKAKAIGGADLVFHK